MVSDATLRAAMMATGFEYTDALWWRLGNETGELDIYVRCNDLFEWACSDLEKVTDENVQSLIDTIAECEAIVGKYDATDAAELWCCRQRNMRPQGACYKGIDEALWHLFDAAGPEREVGLFNPLPQPAA